MERLILDDDGLELLKGLLDIHEATALGIYLEWHESEGAHVVDAPRLMAWMQDWLNNQGSVEHGIVKELMPSLDDTQPLHDEHVFTFRDSQGQAVMQASHHDPVIAMMKLTAKVKAVGEVEQRYERSGL